MDCWTAITALNPILVQVLGSPIISPEYTNWTMELSVVGYILLKLSLLPLRPLLTVWFGLQQMVQKLVLLFGGHLLWFRKFPMTPALVNMVSDI